jgi:hypothetical protein
MIRFFVIFLLLLSFSFGGDLAQRLEKLIQNKDVKTVTILKYDPFFIKKEVKKSYVNKVSDMKTKSKKSLHLIAIFNKKAFINAKWLGVGSSINGYKLKKLYNNKVVLVKKHKQITLLLTKSKNILKIREK